MGEYTPVIKRLQSQHRSSREGAPILMIVVHATAGKDSRMWLVSNPRGVSSHVLIQKDGTIIRMVDDHESAHHAGRSEVSIDGVRYNRWTVHDCNDISLGIELENWNDGKDPYTPEQLRACAWQIEEWETKYSPRVIKFHREIDTEGKTDAHPLRMSDIDRYRAEIRGDGLSELWMTTDSPIYEEPRTGARVALGGTATIEAGSRFQGVVRQDGWAWHSSGIGFLPPNSFTTTASMTPRPTLESSMLGPLDISVERLVRYTMKRKTPYSLVSIEEIWGHYRAVCKAAGVSLIWMASQTLHEASNPDNGQAFGSWWSQRPRRNGVGYGVTGHVARSKPRILTRTYDGIVYPLWFQTSTNTWAEGVSFPTWRHSIEAHVGRVLLYMLGFDGAKDPYQLGLMQMAHAIRPLPKEYQGLGTAPTIFDKRWAVGAEYSRGLLRRAIELATFT